MERIQPCDAEAARAVSRRGLLVAGSLLTTGAFVWGGPSTSAMAAPTTVLAATTLYLNFQTKMALRAGKARSFTSSVSGDGSVNTGGTNLLGTALPLEGGSVPSNRLPTGFDWHSETTTKSLRTLTQDMIGFRANTTTASPSYFGGIRTTRDVVQPGQSVLLSFTPDLNVLSGNTNVSIRVFLLRLSDQRATLGVRAYNAQETANQPAIIRLKAPSGGSGGYRLVFTVEAGSSAAGQQVDVDLANMILVTDPGTASPMGHRYAVPKYFRDGAEARNVIVKPQASAGKYHLLMRTQEFGWTAANVQIAGESSSVDLRAVFGDTANFKVLELYLVRVSKWKKGWMDSLSPVTKWTPVRFLNIENSASKARPESPNRISRMTGLPAVLSSVAAEGNGSVPTIASPPQTWAVSFNPDRLSHHAFEVDHETYILDTRDTGGVRSELLPGESVAFDQDQWISFWTRTNTPIKDPVSSRHSVLFQWRYVRNAAGDSSHLSPEVAFEQLTQNRFRIRYRTDFGTPVLSGDGEAKGITTGSTAGVGYPPGQWNAIVARVRFSRTGKGYLGFWCNGRTVFDGAAAIGYRREVGPRLHYGSYKFSDYAHRVEFQHMEFGTKSLASRIVTPLPV